MYFNINSFDLENKKVGVRIDINSPIINGKVLINERFYRHIKTIKYLLNKDSKIILVAHQGRPGKKDYLPSLDKHAKIMSKLLNTEIIYIDKLLSQESIEFIENLDNGEVVLLENIRNYDFETNKRLVYNNPFTKVYSNILDCYIIDAFSIAHREHSSVVGFKDKIPMAAGILFEEELINSRKLKEELNRPIVYLLGGEKVDDLIDLIEYSVKNAKVDRILSTGFLAVLSLEAAGIKTNDERVESYTDIIKRLEPLISKIEVPNDVAINFHGRRREINVFKLKEYMNTKIYDIGLNTIKEYDKILKRANTIYAKGPAGLFEDPKFSKGTIKLLEAIKENKKAYKFLGGGHIVSALEEFFDKDEFNNTYFSVSGGSVVKFLANKKLPALEALEYNYIMFKNKKLSPNLSNN